MNRRVVITGMEVTTSIGTGLQKFWDSALAGISGTRRIASYDPSPYPTQMAGEVRDFNLEAYPQYDRPKRFPRATRFALFCAHRALEDAGLEPGSEVVKDAGVFLGTGQGGSPEVQQEAFHAYYTEGWKKVPVLSVPRGMPNSSANNVGIELGLGGPNVTITNACTSSAEAIGRAYEQIKWGKLSMVLAGGTEAMIWETMMIAWCKLRVMSTNNACPEKASRPFDQARDGMVMAEGAGFLCLEDLESARARSARIYAEIVGYAATCDASHITAPSSAGQIRAVQGALHDAGLTTGEIDYISAHGTATKLNDLTETQTIKEMFGKRAYDIPVSSLKSMTGHALGAAGVIEIVATALSLREGKMHPTINLEILDPQCDLDYIPNVSRSGDLRVALSNHFAFGGANTVLMLKRYENV